MKQETLGPQLLLDYLIELGTALMSAGCPTHRLEELLVTVARHEGHQADVFAVPTGLFVGVRTPEGEPSLTTMVRVTEWTNDLQLLAALDEVLNEVAERALSIPAARQKIREVQRQPRPWGRGMQLLASAAGSAGAAVTFGGGWTDCLLAGIGGLILRAIMLNLSQSPGVRVLENFIGGLVAATTAWFATLLWPGNSREVLILAIVVQLLPGLTLTTGLAELTYRNLVAGTARLMHAAITLLSLAFGIAAVVSLAQAIDLPGAPPVPHVALAWWWQVLAVLVAALSFGVMLGLSKEKLRIALMSGALVWGVTLLTRPLPGVHAAFLNALVLAVGANVWARVTRKPAQVFLNPGMLLLVPGALSFRSLDTLLSGDAVQGISGLADVTLIAGALVMGLLVANVALPPRKVL
ncbi:MAG: threonine/serine exporter family protein [Archangium sp.]|nr:threonine/serine exporter family protein [Archangium sp.]MDP3158118.1 threonine/serine exporter family protein [Archangium sp.]MDP3570475.1 threonine/serine exporter family protein [Archangium sp.]